MVNKYLLHIFLTLIPASLLVSCGGEQNSSLECVNTFIMAAQQRDMTKAWNTLSPEARKFYNDIGEKNRKSGRGILEHDIDEVVKFRNRTDYKVAFDPVKSTTVFITTADGAVFTIETVEDEGNFKIKDGTSVRNIIKGIAEEMVKKDYY